MNEPSFAVRRWTVLLAALPAVALAASICRGAEPQAAEILKAAGVNGGLVVHLSCGDGQLTAELAAGDAFLVQGLDRDADNVRQAREHVRSRGKYGPVAIDQLQGTQLPFIDNLANLVVAERLDGISMDEVLRVLAPEGSAYVRTDGQWRLTRKPRPDSIDEWTHYLHDPSGNAVAHDTIVGPPRRLQWLSRPRWSRHHDRMASLSALVSAGGRIFYIMDEGSRVSIQLPPKWNLVARDAFNGVELWKTPLASWHNHLWPLKSGPTQLARRLVATGDRVYVTLGIDAPVTALDARTGKLLHTYEGTKGTEELLLVGGKVVAQVNPQESELASYGPQLNVGDQRRVAQEFLWNEQPRQLVVLDAESGQKLWSRETVVAPLSLSATSQRLYFHNGDSLECLDLEKGQPIWSAAAPRRAQITMNFGPKIVAYRDVLLYSGGDGQLRSYDAATGNQLWSAPKPRSAYQSPEDLLVVGDMVWTAPTTGTRDSGVMVGRDPRSGEVKREFPPDVTTYWFHHRCYIAKATDRFLLPSRTGIEFVDLEQNHWDINHWVRGGCLYGIMPANGLTYAPPHNCACYPEAKLYGFNALAPAAAQDAARAEPVEQLVRGPAFGQIESAAASPHDWPTYRHDAQRSGRTTQTVDTRQLDTAWTADLGGRLSSAVVANGQLYVASIDRHEVAALNADSGQPVWTFAAGGRVDSPPTVADGHVLFGSADGCVYCLRAGDGALVWRRRAAPADRRLVAFDQVESLWPVHGSVLVQDGAAYYVAGRSNFLDGGLLWQKVDVKTGRLLAQSKIDEQDPEAGGNIQQRLQILNMPVGLPDVLSADDKYVYMRSQAFDRDGNRIEIGPHSGSPAEQGSVQEGETSHLFAPMGFLDGTYFHRSYWVFGRSFAGGHAGYHQAGRYAPSGRILVVDDDNVYGFARKPQYYRWTTPLEHHLFASSKTPPEAPPVATRRSGATMVKVPNQDGLNPKDQPLTISAWVRAQRPNGVVVARGGPQNGYALVLRNGRPQFAVRAGGELQQVTAQRRATGAWTHVAGVLTADARMTLYVDGQAVGQAKAPSLLTADPQQAMEIGADDGGSVGDYRSPLALTGSVDDVRLYLAALDQADMRSLAAGQNPRDAAADSLVLHLTFDGGDASDESGKKHHGQLLGAKPGAGKLQRAMQFAGGRQGQANTGSFVEHQWTLDIPLLARAMTLAGKTLLVAGPPDVINEEESFQRLVERDPRVSEQLAEQDQLLDGRDGGVLLAVSAETGVRLAEIKLPALPTWDGMIAAQGRIYLTTTDGRILCLQNKESN